MKSILKFTMLAILTFLFTNCNKKGCTDSLAENYQSSATKDDGSCTFDYGGRENGKLSVGLINPTNDFFQIYIDGNFEGTIDTYFGHSNFCDSYDAVEKTVTAGTHLVEVKGVNSGIEAYGYADVDEQECHAFAIDYALNANSSGGSGTGGSGTGGSGTSSYGEVTFWTSVDHGCGQITVTMNGATRSINNYYYNGTPNCGATGCANFSGISPGTYSYSAECSSYYWNGTVTITADNCTLMQLN